MVQTNLFFQLAAGLIPTFLFAGVIAERLKPREGWKLLARHRLLGWVVVLFFTLVPISAEAFAIDGALTGTPGTVRTWFVAGAVMAGTALLSLAFLSPWLRDLWNEPLSDRPVVLLIVAGTIGLAAVSTGLLKSAVDAVVPTQR